MSAIAEENEERKVVAQNPLEKARDREEDASEEDAARHCSCCETTSASPTH